MKTLLWLFLFIPLLAFGQNTPITYPYLKPLPTSGSTPAGTIKLTGVANPTGFADPRPALWDNFLGGSYRVVGTTSERDAINADFRKEGMWVKVTTDSHVYQLDSNLTAWTDLGNPNTWGTGGGSGSIYTVDGSLTGNRAFGGAGFSLTLSGMSSIAQSAVSSYAVTAPTITHIASASYRVQTAATSSGAAENGMFMSLLNNSTGESDYAPAWYKGTATGTGGVFAIANADLSPDYDLSAVPPEFTVLYVKFPEAAAGNDTLQMGPATAAIAITRPDGTPVQANDFSASRVVTLIRSGITSGSRWTLQLSSSAAPSPPTVERVDTANGDLPLATADVVITRGYYAAGDNGDGTYRRDAASAAVINGVTVFDCIAGGRYFLQATGEITALQAGVVGNGSTDDRARIVAYLTASSGKTAHFDALSYRLVGGITIPDDTRIIATGATFVCETAGTPAFRVGSRCIVDGGSWTANRQSGGANGFDNSCFTFGEYTSSGSASNSIIRNVKVAVLNYTASGIFIAGGSYNILVENVQCDDSSTMDDVVTGHWGYVSGSEVNGTLHPHNLTIRNVKVGKLTSLTADASPIFMAACYSVDVDGVQSEEARHGAIAVTGDFGFRYSGFTAQQLGAVSYRNITCLKANNIGILVQNVGVSAQVYPQEYVFETCTMFGPANGANNGGFYGNTARNATFRNCVFARHGQGTTFVNGCQNITFDGCTFATNVLAGVLVDDSNTKNVQIIGCKFKNNGTGTSGTDAAGVKLNAGSIATVERCIFGNLDGDANQEVGVKVVAPFVGAVIAGNHVATVKALGANQAYYLGGASDVGQMSFVGNNTAAFGIVLYANGGSSQWIAGNFPNCTSVVGDANYTYTPHSNCRQLVLPASTPLTAGRTMTLGTTTAIAGETVTFTRLDAGAFTFSFAGKSVPANAWATARFNGTSWDLAQYGTL